MAAYNNSNFMYVVREKTMKIISKSNFDDELVSDKLIATGMRLFWANKIRELLNHHCTGPNSRNIYAVVADDYELYEFKP